MYQSNVDDQLSYADAPVQQAVVSSALVKHTPVNPLNHGSCVFEIPGSDTFMDLSQAYLLVKLKLVKQDGSAVTKKISSQTAGGDTRETDVKVSTVILPVFTLWRSAKLYISNTLVSTHEYFNYESVINSVLNSTEQTRKTSDYMAGFYPLDENAKQMNEDLSNRILDGKGTFIGRLTGGFFDQKRLIPPKVDVRLELTRSDDDWFIINETEQLVQPKVSIQEAALFVRKVQVDQPVHNALNRKFHTKGAVFPFRKQICRAIHVPGNTLNLPFNRLFSNYLPSRIYCVLVNTESWIGQLEMNPMIFENHSLSYMAVRANDRLYPLTNLSEESPNFRDGEYGMQYLNLLRANPNISHSDFGKNCCILAVDMSPTGTDEVSDPIVGDTSLEIRFARETPAGGLVCFVMAEFPTSMCIDKNGYVSIDQVTQ